MDKISKFQIIRMAKERVVVRYYNEEKDQFEKICAAKNAELRRDLLIADGNIYYEYQGRMYYVGREDEIKKVLSDTHSAVSLEVLDVNHSQAPFKALLINVHSCVPVLCYEEIKDKMKGAAIRASLPNGKKVSFFIDHRYDEMGNWEDSYVRVE